jgi:hypothetical protein
LSPFSHEIPHKVVDVVFGDDDDEKGDLLPVRVSGTDDDKDHGTIDRHWCEEVTVDRILRWVMLLVVVVVVVVKASTSVVRGI